MLLNNAQQIASLYNRAIFKNEKIWLQLVLNQGPCQSVTPLLPIKLSKTEIEIS